MADRMLIRALAAFLSLAGASATAQTYDVIWYSMDGGGTSSTPGGTYALAGTVGQADAGSPLVGDLYSVSGGFWPAAKLAPAPEPLGRFYSVTPCRAVDTRGNGAPLQGGALISGIPRALLLAGVCGVPLSAIAVSLNVTAVQATGAGAITLYPWGQGVPGTNAISFPSSAARSNNGVLALAFDGTGKLGALATVTGAGSVHLIIDVNGYFE